MNDRMRRGCCRLLALLLTLVLVIPAYGQETLDALHGGDTAAKR